MTKQLYQNNAASTLTATVSAAATSISVADGTVFPSPTGTDFFLVTLSKTGGNEIVRCTARVGNVLTVERGQEGTVANTFAANDLIEMRITAGTLDTVRQEILNARGNRMNLNDRISLIGDISGPNIAPPVVGRYYDNAFTPASLTATYGLTSNRFTAVGYSSPHRWRIDRLGVHVVNANPGTFRCFIYSAKQSDCLADQQLFVGALELDTSTAGLKEHILDFIFEADTLYWLGINGEISGTSPSIRSMSAGSAKGFGPVGPTDTAYRTGFNKTGLPAISPLPVTAPVADSDLIAFGLQVPIFRMRAAAL